MILEEEVISKDTLKLQITGDLDAHTADELRDSLENILDSDHRKIHLILDLEGVNFIDSSGLGVILGCYRKVSKRNGKVIIINPQPHVQKILELSGINRVIPVVRDMERATERIGEKGVEK